MSLAMQVADLTAKVTGLYDLVKGQYTKWDNKVKAFTNDIRASIIGKMYSSYVVDAVAGDDGNLGTYSSPFKTIKKAIDEIPIGGQATIYLKGGQTYDIDSLINISGKNIFLSGDDINHPLVKSVFFLDSNENGRAGSFKSSKASSTFTSRYVDFETCDNEILTSYTGNMFEAVYSKLDLFLYKCDVEIKELPFLFGYSDIATVSLTMAQGTVTRNSSNPDAVLIRAYGCLIGISFGAMLLSGNITNIKELILGIKTVGGIPINVQSTENLQA